MSSASKWTFLRSETKEQKEDIKPDRPLSLYSNTSKKSKHFSSCSNLAVNNSRSNRSLYSFSPSLLRRCNSSLNKNRKMSTEPEVLSGPEVNSWTKSKSCKRVQAIGRVFGTYVDKDGGFVLSVMNEKSERCIQFYDNTSTFKSSFPLKTTKSGKYFDAFQITMTPKTHVAVACKTSVTVWSKEGKLLMEHGKGMLKFAKWIAVRSTEELIVSDTDDNCVKIISPNGQQITKLPTTFYSPTGVAVDSNDYLIVADWHDKIRIFDAENNLLQTFGVKGSGDAELDLPYGITVDCENNIVVADMWNDRISLYTQQGIFKRHVVGRGAEECANIGRPAYVAVSTSLDSKNFRLIVSDFSGGLTTVFEF